MLKKSGIEPSALYAIQLRLERASKVKIKTKSFSRSTSERNEPAVRVDVKFLFFLIMKNNQDNSPMHLSAPLRQMSVEEKLQATGEIGAELAGTTEKISAPAWHIDVLQVL